MFDNFEPLSEEEEKPRDWSGAIIAAAVSPVFFVFVYLGKPDLGFTVCIALGMIALAVRLRWKSRKHVWFWATIAVVLALHLPILSRFLWTDARVHTIAFPLALVDFLIVSGALMLAEKLFSKDLSSDEES